MGCCEPHTLCLLPGFLTRKGRAHTKGKKKNEQILYVVTGQSTALDLYSPETLTVKDLKGAERSLFSALVGQLLATGAWRFPQWQAFSLKRRVCATHAPVRVRKALLFNNYFQPRHRKMLFAGHMCDGAITAPL